MSLGVWLGPSFTCVLAILAFLTFRANVQEKRLEQASAVHVWIRNAVQLIAPGHFTELPGWQRYIVVEDTQYDFTLSEDEKLPKIELLNASGHPVYDLEATITWDVLFAPSRIEGDRHGPIMVHAGSLGFNVTYTDRLEARAEFEEEWKPWGGETGVIGDILKGNALDDIPSPVPPTNNVIEFPLDESIKFVADSYYYSKKFDEEPVAIVCRIKEVKFVDRGGRYWRRSPSGRLQRCKTPTTGTQKRGGNP